MTRRNYKKCLTHLVQTHARIERTPLNNKLLQEKLNKALRERQTQPLDKSAKEFTIRFDRSKSEAYTRILRNLKEILKTAKPDEEGRIEIPFFIHQTLGDISFGTTSDPAWTEGLLVLTEAEVNFKTKNRLAGFGSCYLQEIKQGLLSHKKEKPSLSWLDALSKLNREVIYKEFKTFVDPFCLSSSAVPSIVLSDSHITPAHKIHFSSQAYIGIAEPRKTDLTFWKLALEQNVDVIVKLNQTENAPGAVSSETYWPVFGEIFKWDNFSVECKQETALPNNMCARVFEIINGMEKKQLTQLDYMGWKDMRIPDFSEMVALLDQADALNKNNKTLLVHCTAGQGRTGTFIAAHHLKHNPDQDITKTVLKLRKQRPCPMVETPSQYYRLHKIQTHFYNNQLKHKVNEQ